MSLAIELAAMYENPFLHPGKEQDFITAAELRRLAAVEKELELIRALEPVAWLCEGFNPKGVRERVCVAMNPQKDNPLEKVTPLFALKKDPT